MTSKKKTFSFPDHHNYSDQDFSRLIENNVPVITTEKDYLRIDDKINRIQQGAGLLGEDEDVIQDLIGYLILLKIAFKRQQKDILADLEEEIERLKLAKVEKYRADKIVMNRLGKTLSLIHI